MICCCYYPDEKLLALGCPPLCTILWILYSVGGILSSAQWTFFPYSSRHAYKNRKCVQGGHGRRCKSCVLSFASSMRAEWGLIIGRMPVSHFLTSPIVLSTHSLKWGKEKRNLQRAGGNPQHGPLGLSWLDYIEERHWRKHQLQILHLLSYKGIMLLIPSD